MTPANHRPAISALRSFLLARVTGCHVQDEDVKFAWEIAMAETGRHGEMPALTKDAGRDLHAFDKLFATWSN